MGKIEKIKMRDFKSFRNTIIPFVDGFTTVVGPNGSGKCLIGDSQLILANGKQTTIGELVEDQISRYGSSTLEDGEICLQNPEAVSLLSLNMQTKKIKAMPVKAFVKRTSPEKLVKIKTKSGREVVTTLYHPLFTVKNGEIASLKAEELKPGERIATPRKLETKPQESTIEFPEYFTKSDGLYVPHSESLVNGIRALKKNNTWVELAKSAGVPYHSIKGLLDGQSINICNLNRLMKLNGLREKEKELITEVKSRKKAIKPVWSTDNELARFLGYMISEGRNSSQNQMRFVNQDEALIDDFCQTSEMCFGVEPKVFQYDKSAKDVIIFSHPLCKTAEKIFGMDIDGHSSTKKAPPQIFESDKEIVASFLSALFEGDAYINPDYVEYCTASKQLAKDVSTLLLQLAIPNVIREKEKSATNTTKKTVRNYYSVFVYGVDNLKTLAGQLEFKGRKAIALQKFRYSEKKINPNQDLIPGVNELIKKYIKKTAISVKKNRAECPKLAAYYENRCMPSRKGLTEVLDYVGVENVIEKTLRSFAESDVLWDEITDVRIINSEEKWVYDLTVEGHHNFIAENIFVHNSNLNDAMMFVLGEGSMKSLRAGRLTDLVHHSSKTGEAEVTIELRDNGEKYKLTRVIDKKGSSVYRLNDKRTTRSEIVELLASMQIPPEGYNIIMQGDVMNIINMTPRQRREVIDDISGIAEYNMKKEKAIRELEKVGKKIGDANIILYERGGYLKEIKKERDEAIRYRRFEEEEKQLKHAIIHRELVEVEEKYRDSSGKVSALGGDLEELSHSLKGISGRISRLEGELSSLQKEIIAKGETEQIGISKEIEQLKSRLSLVQEKVRNREEDIQKAKADIEKSKRKIAESRNEAKEKKSALESLKTEDKSYEERIKEKDGELSAYMAELREKNLLVGDITKKFEEMNQAIAEKKEKFYELKGQMDQAREKIEVKRIGIKDRGAEREESGKRIEELKEAFDSANRQFAERKRGMKGFEMELEQLFSQEKSLNRDLFELDSELDGVREKYHALQSKVSTIRHMTGNMASDSVMKAREELPGVIGRVEDLCEFDVEYATAIQTAAGARMHFIVTKDSSSATNAIRWLKTRKLGRTTFIPLDRIKPVEIGQEAQKAMGNPKAVDFAIKLVRFKAEHRDVFSYVFGDTVVVEDIGAAKEIGFGTCRMATLDGDLAESSGAVTGGFRQGTLTLQEIRRVDELKEKIDGLQKKKEKILRGLEETREQMNRQRGQKAEAELKVREFEVRVNELRQRMDEYSAMAKKYTMSEGDVKAEIESLRKGLSEGEERLKSMLADIKSDEEKKETAKEKIDSPEARIVSQRIEEMQKRLQALRDQRAEIIIQINSISSELEKFMRERERAHEESISENAGLIEKWESEIAGLKKSDSDVQSKLGEKMAFEREISSSIRGLVERRDSMESEIRKLAEQRGQQQRQHDTKQSQYNEENFKKAKWETRYADLKSEFDEEMPVKKFDMTVEKMKEEMEGIKNKRIKLEPINLAAVDKYDKYLTELDLMKEKANKLLEEKKAVLGMMESIETRRKEAFIETFTEIQKHFGRIYKQFYPETGAFADLKLQNEENPFEGGLLIEARPAGKPLKVIDAMSGGEKTLAALAFLFGVQSYKPSPFYILDEADAALDKPNSERLAQMIAGKTEDSQFIVITHNNSMIRFSDQIVGVSMDKKNGSSVVEVDLKRLEQPVATA